MKESQINLRLLIDGCLKGNRGSQRHLYERYYGFGMKLCRRYTANQAEAAEVLNDGFLKVFGKLHQYDSSRPFEAWLRTILVNQSIDFYRSQLNKPKFVALEKAKDLNPLIRPSASSEDEQISNLIKKLPPAYRLVFNLYVMEEYRHDEIAEMLNISSSTSRSNLHRAKEILRTMYDKKKNKGIKSR